MTVARASADRRIRALRPAKPTVDAWRAHGTAVDEERRPGGTIERALTVFLAGAECPFTCAFCDLWRWYDQRTDAARRAAAPVARRHRGARRPYSRTHQAVQREQLLRRARGAGRRLAGDRRALRSIRRSNGRIARDDRRTTRAGLRTPTLRAPRGRDRPRDDPSWRDGGAQQADDARAVRPRGGVSPLPRRRLARVRPGGRAVRAARRIAGMDGTHGCPRRGARRVVGRADPSARRER